jgi:hypothetical protein
MKPSSSVRSRLAPCLLSVAIACSACASRPSPSPLKEEYKLQFDVSYELPPGSTVTWEPDYPAGNCIKDQEKWTDTVAADGKGGGGRRSGFTAINDWPKSCGWERSTGSWNVTVQAPEGSKASANVEVTTRFYPSGTWGSECHSLQDVECKGGDADSALFDRPVPPLHLGPMYLQRAPDLSCTGGIRARKDQPIQDVHICTLEGYPRPKLSVAGITSKVSVRRWPTERDTWLVVSGVFDYATTIQITAYLPGGWTAYRTVQVELE